MYSYADNDVQNIPFMLRLFEHYVSIMSLITNRFDRRALMSSHLVIQEWVELRSSMFNPSSLSFRDM